MKFAYEAADAKGKVSRGEIDAASHALAVEALQARGITPLSVDVIAAAQTSTASARRFGRVPRAQITLAVRQLADLVEAGVLLPDALQSVAAQTPEPRLAQTLTDVSQRVRQGESLAQACAAHAKIFSPLMRAMLAAGSEAGRLDTVLTQLADYLDARDTLTQKLTTALIYPALVAFVSFGVVLAMVTYVMPQVVGVFAQGKQALPWLTRALIGFTSFVRAHAGALLLAAFAIAALLWTFSRWKQTRSAWDRFVLGLPVIGGFVRELELTRFLQTLAMLTSAGVPLLNAFAAARNVVQRAPLREAVGAAERDIAQGSAITPALAATGQFPPMVLQLTRNGEATGQLAAMLTRAARTAQQGVERRAGWLTALIEPALIVVMGGVVLILVLAVMLPIVTINTIIR
jgi:general secretion pathway protein F